MKARVFNIMQYEKHPETGETLLTEDTIRIALAHRTIKQWAYIRHNQDDDKVDFGLAMNLLSAFASDIVHDTYIHRTPSGD